MDMCIGECVMSLDRAFYGARANLIVVRSAREVSRGHVSLTLSPADAAVDAYAQSDCVICIECALKSRIESLHEISC
ncbi:hypothetical protein Tco_1013148 [Tanacetum coccineum]